MSSNVPVSVFPNLTTASLKSNTGRNKHSAKIKHYLLDENAKMISIIEH